MFPHPLGISLADALTDNFPRILYKNNVNYGQFKISLIYTSRWPLIGTGQTLVTRANTTCIAGDQRTQFCP